MRIRICRARSAAAASARQPTRSRARTTGITTAGVRVGSNAHPFLQVRAGFCSCGCPVSSSFHAVFWTTAGTNPRENTYFLKDPYRNTCLLMRIPIFRRCAQKQSTGPRRDGECTRVTLKNSQNKSPKSKQSTVARTDGEWPRVTISNKTHKFFKTQSKDV